MAQLRESKKRETRQRISDLATELFFERGFDAVTVEEIAVAAQVSKMTVFNYFARKEELILDREDDLKLLPLRQALAAKPREQSVADALRMRITDLNQQAYPLCHVDSRMASWWRAVDASPALRARLRELDEEAAEGLAIALGGPAPGGVQRLMAGMIVLTLRTAREEGLRLLRQRASGKKANAAFLELVAHGLSAIDLLALPGSEPD